MMKTHWLIVSLFLLASCYPNSDISPEERILKQVHQVHMPEFHSLCYFLRSTLYSKHN